MSALRAPQTDEQSDSNVIYLVVPPTASMWGRPPLVVERASIPLSLSESFCLQWVALVSLLASNDIKRHLDFVRLLAVVLVLGPVAIYALYLYKSAMGIDLFPTLHIEDFAPVRGWMRW